MNTAVPRDPMLPGQAVGKVILKPCQGNATLFWPQSGQGKGSWALLKSAKGLASLSKYDQSVIVRGAPKHIPQGIREGRGQREMGREGAGAGECVGYSC